MDAGRNIHALDPYRMPSQAALERGWAVAQGILDSHKQANAGAHPETVAVRAAARMQRSCSMSALLRSCQCGTAALVPSWRQSCDVS